MKPSMKKDHYSGVDYSYMKMKVNIQIFFQNVSSRG